MGRAALPRLLGPNGEPLCRTCGKPLEAGDRISNGVTTKRGPRTWMEWFCKGCRDTYNSASKKPGAWRPYEESV